MRCHPQCWQVLEQLEVLEVVFSARDPNLEVPQLVRTLRVVRGRKAEFEVKCSLNTSSSVIERCLKSLSGRDRELNYVVEQFWWLVMSR